MGELTTRDLNRATLARQLLLERHELPVTEAVERLAGMQGQEPKHPFIGLWTRLAGFETGDLHDALHDRRLVRATMMRGTLHLVSAADYTSYRSTLRPVLEAGLAVLGDRAAGLEPDKVTAAATGLLGERGPLTFADIRAALQERFPDVNDRALGYATRMLVPLVMVPDDSRWSFPSNAPFTPAENWLGRPPEPEAAAEEFLLRYLAAFGPATPQDFQTWSGLQQAKPLFEAVHDRLTELTADGKTLYDVPDAPRPGEDAAAPPRYLPEFDNLLLSHAVRTRIIDDAHKPAVFTKNLRVKSTYLIDGRVAGLWTTDVKRGTATLRITPFGRLLKRDAAALEKEGDALLRFAEPDAKAYSFIVE